MKKNMIIRTYEKKDLKDIYSLFQNELGYDQLDIQQLYKQIEMMKNEKTYYIFVACQEEKVIGFIGISLGLTFEMPNYIARIIALAVNKDFQNQKVATRLIKYTEDYLKMQHISIMTLNSGLQRKGAHQFYEKMGFNKKGYSFLKKDDKDSFSRC